jgi:hypothetical protein
MHAYIRSINVIAQHAIMFYDDTKLLSHENKIGQK